jgi:hypothetical protein
MTRKLASRTSGIPGGRLDRIVAALQTNASVSYIVDSRYRFLYCNPAWDRFAKSNGAPQLAHSTVIGTSLFHAIPEILQPLYSQAFNEVLIKKDVWELLYECSSPTLFRKYLMRIHPLRKKGSFLVTNTLAVERSHSTLFDATSEAYCGNNGLIMMCAHCRCTRRVGDPESWDFVPEYFLLPDKDSLRVTHGLCPVCHAYFY